MANEDVLAGLRRRDLLKGLGGGAAAIVAGGAVLAACADEAGGGGEATGTTAASGGATEEVTTAAEGDVDLSGIEPGRQIGVLGFVLSSETPGRGKTELERVAAEVDWDIEFVDANGDATKMPGFVDDFITKEKDAMFAWVFPGTLLGDGAEAARRANIPILGVFTGAGPGITARIEPSEWISEARIGEYVTQRMNYEGEIALLNWEEIPPLKVRGAVIREMLAFYPDIKVVADEVLKVPGQVEDAKAKTAALLTQNPNLKAVWAGWDEVGVAASQAVMEAGRNDVFVASIDGNLTTFDAIRNGEPMACTCANDIELMARVAVQQADALLKGETVPAVTNVDSPFVSKDNVPARGELVRGRVTPFFTGA